MWLTVSSVQIVNIYRYSVFAQGVPLLIVILTAVVDSQAPEGEEERKYYPNM